MKGIKGFSQAKVGSSNNNKSIFGDITPFRFDEHAGEKVRLRLVGPVVGLGIHWIEIRKKKGGTGKFPKLCLNYNSDTDEFDDNGCPYCDANRSQRKYLVNAIIRSIQDDEPKKQPERVKSEKKLTNVGGYECFVKDPSSKSWTPVQVLSIPAGVAYELKDLTETNTDKKGNVHELSDDKYGMDITIRYNPEKAGESKYRVDTVERTPLTDEEKEYLLYDITNLPVESLKEAKAEYERFEENLVVEDRDEDDVDDEDDELDVDDEDDDEPKSKKSKKSKHYDDDDEDDEEDFDDEDDEDDDEDERPSKKSKKKSKHYDDDEDDDDDDEAPFDTDDDDDEDDEPKSKKSKKSKKDKKSKKKSKHSYDDDDDDLDDLD